MLIAVFLGCEAKEDYLIKDIKSDCSELYHFIFATNNEGKTFIIVSPKNKIKQGIEVIKGKHYSFSLQKMTDSILEKKPLYEGIDNGDTLVLLMSSIPNYIPCDTFKIGPMQHDLYFDNSLNNLYFDIKK